MSKETKATPEECEALWEKITKRSKPVHSSDGKRESEGSYVSGWSESSDTWNLNLSVFALKARSVHRTEFNLHRDFTGVQSELVISKGKKTIFRATKQGPTKTDKFTGSDERFAGTEEKPGEPWKIKKGSIPPSLFK